MLPVEPTDLQAVYKERIYNVTNEKTSMQKVLMSIYYVGLCHIS